MLRKIIRLFIIPLIICALAACKGKSQEQAQPVYKMSAMVNGYKWYQNTVTSTLLNDTNHDVRIIDIIASSGGKTITIEFLNDGAGTSPNTGTYSYPDAYFHYAVSSGSVYNTVSGFITISGVNTSAGTLSGNFDFKVQDASSSQEVPITNGKLVDASYTVTYQ